MFSPKSKLCLTALGVLVAIACLKPIAAEADILALRDGRKLQGTVSNRPTVQSNPGLITQISFLTNDASGTATLQRFDVDDVEYLLIEAHEGPSVIDFEQARQGIRSANSIPHQEETPKKKISWSGGLKGGSAFSKFQGDDAIDISDMRTGISFGASVTAQHNAHLGLRFECLYIQKGAQSRTTRNDNPIKVEFRLDYVEFPFLIVLRKQAKRVALSGFAGPSAAFLVHSVAVSEGFAAIGEPAFDGETDLTDIATFDISLRGGLGVDVLLAWKTSLTLEVSYGQGIVPFDEDRNPSNMTTAAYLIMGGVSYAFGGDDTD